MRMIERSGTKLPLSAGKQLCIAEEVALPEKNNPNAARKSCDVNVIQV